MMYSYYYLKLADDASVVLELLLGLLAAVELERLQPLREAVVLRLRLQFVREHLLRGKGKKRRLLEVGCKL